MGSHRFLATCLDGSAQLRWSDAGALAHSIEESKLIRRLTAVERTQLEDVLDGK
jgi:hypothetical protein